MGIISRNALISISQGKIIGFSKIKFNMPEEMKFAFPISELFKTEIIGFNLQQIEFKQESGKYIVVLNCSITKTNMATKRRWISRVRTKRNLIYGKIFPRFRSGADL